MNCLKSTRWILFKGLNGGGGGGVHMSVVGCNFITLLLVG